MGGKAQDDIAEQYGISQSYISRIIKRSILKMQKAYQRSLA
jgi:DNA-directed RNA polymerase specialized sigma subunit